MKNVLVIGDSCEDRFQYGVCNRLSPEAPVPVFTPTKLKVNGGMALNVYENIKALGMDCEIISNKILPIKTRYVDDISNQMLLRVDENDNIQGMSVDDFEMIDFHMYDAVVISDYNKGFLSEKIIELICNVHDLVFMDSKKKLDEWAFGVEFIKINEKEAEYNNDWLTNKYKGELIVTMGDKGARHWYNNVLIENKHPVRDLSGAGDTFLAAFVVKYLEKNHIVDAISFANKCASWVVTKKGVVTVNSNFI